MKKYADLVKPIANVIAAGIISLVFQNCNGIPQIKTDKPTNGRSMPDTHLGELMGHLQYNVLKLGLSLQHRNQRLADFYMHEVNESYIDIASKRIIDGNLDISSLIAQILGPSKDRLAAVISKNDTAQFIPAYHAMIGSCNNCHMETNHNYIVIEEPHLEYNGQNFGQLRNLYSE